MLLLLLKMDPQSSRTVPSSSSFSVAPSSAEHPSPTRVSVARGNSGDPPLLPTAPTRYVFITPPTVELPLTFTVDTASPPLLVAMTRAHTVPDGSASHASIIVSARVWVPLLPRPALWQSRPPPLQLHCLSLASNSILQFIVSDPTVVEYLILISAYFAHMSLPPPHLIIPGTGSWSYL